MSGTDLQAAPLLRYCRSSPRLLCHRVTAMREYKTIMTASGATYSTVKLIMSKSLESYFRRWVMQMVSDWPLERFVVTVPTQMKRGDEYRALATHTTTITICNGRAQFLSGSRRLR